MKKSAKVLFSLLLCGSLFSVTACNNSGNNSTNNSSNVSDNYEKDEQYEIFELAVSEGKFNGTYEEWLSSIKGEDGKPGKNGQSAYELYKQLHPEYKGTLEEWLESLKGSDGKDGADGHDGADGADGKDGADGTNGVNGKSAYEIYKEAHPEYSKSEEEWLHDLVNGNLATKVTHTVTFDTMGGSEVAPQEIEHLNKVKKPETTKDGYLFDGWYVGDEKWVFAGYNVTKDITLKAHWIKNEFKVNINFDNGNPNQELVKQYNDELILTAPEKQDYLFVGWADEKGNLLEEPIIVKNSMSIKAVYTNKINISFDTKGGNLIDTQEFLYNKDIENLPIPTKEEALFNGWYYKDGNKEVMVELPLKCSFKSDVTLYAKWTPLYKNYLYEPYGNGYIIKGYNGNENILNIPSTINGKLVTNIDKYAFSNNENIQNVIIPEGVKDLSMCVFENCSNLEIVKLPNTLTEIPWACFRNCSKLKTIKLPSNLTSIDVSAFENCSMLDNIVIPNSVTKLSVSAFEKCTNLKNLTLSDNLSVLQAAFGNCTSLVNIVIPKAVTVIDNGLFYNCSSLTNITFKGDITTIKSLAFNGCTSLTEITIPNTVKTIEYSAFGACSNLKKVIIPKSVEIIGAGVFDSNILDIYCEADSKPVGFDESWYYSAKSITWGYKPQ